MFKIALVSSDYSFNDSVINFAAGIAIRANSTVYALNDRIRPITANGHWYLCTTAGTSGASILVTWATDGSTATDGSVVWTDQGINPAACEISGTGYTAGGAALENKIVTYDDDYGYFDADDVVWANSTITARRAELYRVGVVNGVENPIWCSLLFNDTPADVSSTNSDFTIVWNANGIIRLG